MATTVTNPDKFKYLDYVGLQTLVNKIKGLIDASNSAAAVEKVTYDASTNTFKLTQGTTDITSDAIAVVSASNNGLMTPDQLKTLTDVNTNKVQRICVSVDGSHIANTLRYDETKENDKLAIIDYTTKLGELDDTTKKQAPTAEAVKNALDTKVNTEDYNKDKTTFALEASVKQRFEDLPNTYYTEDEINTKIEEINKAISDGDALKLNFADFAAYLAEQKTKDEGQDAAITSLQEFVGTTGITSTNVYNKTEVDDAIAAAKKAILLGEEEGPIAETYDTILEIANWITSDETGAAGLAKQVATNTADIATNKANIEANDKDIASLQQRDVEFTNSIAQLEAADVTLGNRVGTLETTVGDANSGLVQDVANLKTTVGDANSGLVKSVADLAAADEAIVGRLNVIEGTGDGSIKKAIATIEDKAVGSFGEITLDNTDGKYKMQVKSVSGTKVLQTVVFETFTTTEIEALFN